ncbi:MAG: DUF167 domain-containing protein [Dehalococcoidia bacterium]|nr:DUF167 domain-containing protein [Dehalococcoidia bacterium]
MTRITVQLTPRASRNEIVEVTTAGHGLHLRARVTAPPVDGRANAAIEELLARALGVAPSTVRVVVGASARRKVLEVGGLTAEEVRSRLERAR